MFGTIAAFELRYQLRSPVFWVGALLFFLMAFGATTSDRSRSAPAATCTSTRPSSSCRRWP
jgi:ABC-2 type transport system permease protein